ncbi:MAG: transporter substrate-binding domain-containing protein [Treponemataceae bacterium]
MIKKINTLVVSALLITSILMGCAKEEGSKLEQIKKKGKIVLGTSADYPPFEFHLLIDGKDEIVGFDVEIAKEIANDLGVELEVRDMGFDGLLAALVSNNVDMVISGMTPTEERKQNVAFSDIYYTATHGAIIRRADEDMYAYNSDSLADAPVGAQKGSIQVEIAKEQIKGVTGDALQNNHPQVKELGTMPDLILDLQGEKIDAVIAEIPVAQPYVQKHQDLMIAGYRFDVAEDGSAIAIKKGNQDFVDAVNETLQRLVSEGKINQFISDANELANQL